MKIIIRNTHRYISVSPCAICGFEKDAAIHSSPHLSGKKVVINGLMFHDYVFENPKNCKSSKSEIYES